ncbi:hypothetical protein HID58_068952 [Brassica napus]|uniref:RRM domain-containing protein n=1 Tax=Brassica napus TaxID=3708 RepID=A0ABQ7ZNG1_BRANA|nr:hypothetical protein HID58_068952 [Brassica napus]
MKFIVSDKIDCNNVGSGMEGIDIRPGGYWSKIKELNDSYAGSSIIRRMVVKGYDTSPHTPREDVEEALRKHFASQYEAKALKLQGSDMGGRILEITSYPFEDNHLDHVFPPCNPSDDIRQRTLKITGFDTSLDEDDIDKMLLEFFPESGIMDICNGTVRGSKFAVTTVLPIKLVRCGLSRAARLPLGKKA